MSDLQFPNKPRSRPTATLRPSQRGGKSNYGGKGTHGVFLYVAWCKGFAKIGISDNPKQRVSGINSACPFPVTLVSQHMLRRHEAMQAEIDTMKALDAFHWKSDWFRCTKAAAIYAAEQAVVRYK